MSFCEFSPGRLRSLMRVCLRAAEKGVGKVDPNPMVGAALVNRKGEVLKTGFHRKHGATHAEVDLLQDVETVFPEDTVFVSLEPCNHVGKTPPCTEFLLSKGVKNLVVGSADPNPLMNGRSIEFLKNKGVNVRVGVLEEECKMLNRVFNHHIIHKTPFVALKVAMSLDGKIAPASRNSKWITNENARKRGHYFRSFYGGIAIGIGTAKQDNPLLNSRLKNSPAQPVRVLFDREAKISPESQWAASPHSRKLLIADSQCAPKDRLHRLEKMGAEIYLPKNGTQICEDLMRGLFERGVTSLMVEGGRALLTSFIRSGRFQAIHLFMAPKLIGGDGLDWYGPPTIPGEEEIKKLNLKSMKKHRDNLELFLMNE